MRLLLIATLIALTCGCPAPRQTRPQQTDPQQPLPIWAPLTDFEYAIVEQAKTSDDEEVWLQISFIMGGRTRTAEDARTPLARYRRFLTEMEPQVEVLRDEDPLQMGDVLYQSFHEQFLGHGQGRHSLENYEIDQHQSDVLLQTGRYNCASSAIVYGLIARHFGFGVEGVVMPSHLFLRLSWPGLDPIDVETTSPDGYGVAHDQGYYATLDKSWAIKRGLPVLTHNDYLEREIIPLSQAILLLSATPTDVAGDDRLRLFEIAGYLSPDPLLQYNRLTAWNHYCWGYYEDGEFAQAVRMFAVLGHEIEAVRAAYHRDPEIAQRLAWLYMGWAMVTVRHDGSLQALDYTDESMSLIPQDHEEREKLELNAFGVHVDLIEDALERGDFEQAMALFERTAERFPRYERVPELREYVYATIGSTYFERRQWQEAIEVLRHCREPVERNGEAVCRVYMEAAYVNWAVDLANSGNAQAALEVLEACLNELPDAPSCAEAYRKIRSY